MKTGLCKITAALSCTLAALGAWLPIDALAGESSPLPGKLEVIINPGEEDMEVLYIDAPENLPAGQQGVPLDLSGEIDVEELLGSQPTLRERLETGDTLEKARAEQYPDSFPGEFSLFFGMKEESLNFTIADNRPGGPNILSELEWEDVNSYLVGGELHWTNNSGIYLLGRASFGSVAGGDNQDSDFAGSNRTLEFSRSYSDTNGGSSFDASLGLGWRFDMEMSPGKFRLTPMVGLALYTQQVEDKKARQSVSQPNSYGIRLPDIGPFAYEWVNKTYDTQWYGPWIGLEAELMFTEHHALCASLGLHYFQLEADGDWRLRDDLANPVSFRHDSDGTGVVAGLRYTWRPTARWSFFLGGEYRDFKTNSGTDWTYPAGGGGKFPTRLNEVESEGYLLQFGVGYSF